MALPDGDPQVDHRLMSSQIAVGYDGSSTSADAVRWAAAEAGCRNVRLRVVSCFEIPYLGGPMAGWALTEATDSLRSATEATALAMQLSISEEHPMVPVVTDVSPGPAADVLTDGLTDGDLVVVGRSSRHGASAFWLGSTPRNLVRHSPCPVVVISGAATGGHPDRVVVGTDGSAASDAAVRWAAAEADLHHVELVVVHSWEYPYLPADVEGFSARDITHVDAACVLDCAVELARSSCGVQVTGRLVEDGSASGLLESVQDGDLLVVGSRGRGAIRTGLFGSTVNSLLELADVPVAVVRKGPA